MKRSLFFYTVFCFSVLLLLSPSSMAQNRSTDSQASNGNGFSLNFSSELGGFYFQDINGLQIALEGVPYEGIIDEERYILGVNDLVSVEVESTQRLIFKSLAINSSGDIVLPSTGVIKVSGLTIAEAVERIEEKLSQTYRSPEVTLSVEVPRKINVHVAGSVPHPGKFTIPAQSRVDLAILQSIVTQEIKRNDSETALFQQYTSDLLQNNRYSLRNIRITHKDGTTTTADLIDYFRTGDLDSNPVVFDGDQIEIQRLGLNSPTVSITGAVRFGNELEYKAGETIDELLAIAEYFTENADTSHVLVIRRDRSETERIEVDSDRWSTYTLQPNDRVVVPELENSLVPATAWVTGEIEYPGNYPIISGETMVSELLELSGGITASALPQASYLVRGTSLENEIPNKFNADLMARTSDQYVQGLEYLRQETALSRNRVHIDLNNEAELDDIPLFNGDRLFIPKDEQTIFVFGQVNNPGYFPYLPDQDLSVYNYISRAGGYALSADRNRVFIIKAGNSSWHKPDEATLESGDRIFVDRNPTEDLNASRTYEIQRQQIRNTRIQLIMTGLTTITSIITAYIAVTRN